MPRGPSLAPQVKAVTAVYHELTKKNDMRPVTPAKIDELRAQLRNAGADVNVRGALGGRASAAAAVAVADTAVLAAARACSARAAHARLVLALPSPSRGRRRKNHR